GLTMRKSGENTSRSESRSPVSAIWTWRCSRSRICASISAADGAGVLSLTAVAFSRGPQATSNVAHSRAATGIRRRIGSDPATDLHQPPAKAHEQETPVPEELRRFAFEGVTDELQHPAGCEQQQRRHAPAWQRD